MSNNGKLLAPFPYFGGKSTVANIVWDALGDCDHYLEPFFGSGAVLLGRPDYDPARHTETICDKDPHIANVWRAIQFKPDETARWCDWPVNHTDLSARTKYLNACDFGKKLLADPQWCDPTMAGYWIYCTCCSIGYGFIRPNQRPHLSTAGQGVHKRSPRPHLADTGKGIAAKGRHHQADTNDPTAPYNINIYRWFRRLSERLYRVRVCWGDWHTICGGDWQAGHWSRVGVFMDPPYSAEANRDPGIYACDSQTVAHNVRDWCRKHADDPKYRIVLAGYYDEHESLLSENWTVHRYSTKGGMGNTGDGQGKINRHKEAFFSRPIASTIYHCSPH